MSKVRPVYNAAADKLKGKDVLVYINFGETATYEAPVWCLIGGQTDAKYTIKADSIDGSNKTSGGWGETYSGIKTSELSMSGIRCKNDEGYNALKDAFLKDEKVDIVRYSTDGGAERNWYSVTDLSDSTPHDDMASFDATLEGVGKPTFYSGLLSITDVKGAGGEK